MSITIIVGGQYGSEGKGKVAHYMAKKKSAKFAVRCGGSNSGHTVVCPKKGAIVLRQLPTASIIDNITSILSAGSYIDINILNKEIELTGIHPSRLFIDPNAVIIGNKDINSEIENDSLGKISSTCSGTGSAVLKRISRTGGVVFAKDKEELRPYIRNTKDILRSAIDQGQHVILEGTQGFGLSVLHSDHYPYVTSRDTTAAGFLSEVGLSPFDVEDICLVIRTYPIRVEGNSGPLVNEISWDDIPLAQPELTSVTKKVRRIANFDPEIVKKSIISNRPNKIILNHIDYIDENNQLSFIENIEKSIGQKINFIGTSDMSLRELIV